jgi:hypothetical protein
VFYEVCFDSRSMEAWQVIRKGLAVALLQPLFLFLEAPAMIQILNLQGEIKYPSRLYCWKHDEIYARKQTIDKVPSMGPGQYGGKSTCAKSRTRHVKSRLNSTQVCQRKLVEFW